MIEKDELYDGVVMKLSSILFLFGLLTGIYVSTIATGVIEGNLQASLAAHINGIIGALIILSLILVLPRIMHGNRYKYIMIILFAVSNYSNWLLTLIKSFLKVDGIEIIENAPSNNLIHILLIAFVVLPSLIGASMWVIGTYSLDRKKTL